RRPERGVDLADRYSSHSIHKRAAPGVAELCDHGGQPAHSRGLRAGGVLAGKSEPEIAGPAGIEIVDGAFDADHPLRIELPVAAAVAAADEGRLPAAVADNDDTGHLDLLTEIDRCAAGIESHVAAGP